MTSLRDLVGEWRAEASRLRDRYAEEHLAKLCEAHADELEAALRAEADAELSLEEAARESGYSRAQLRRLFPEGRIRRRDLPRKARLRTPAHAPDLRPEQSGVSQEEAVSDDVRAALDRRFGRRAG